MSALSKRRRWTVAHRLVAAAFLLIIVLGRSDWFPLLKGGVSTSLVAGLIPFADPLIGLEVMLASRTVPLQLALGVGIVVVIYAVLGRAFCGWLCPLGLILELNESARRWADRRLRLVGRRLPSIQLSRRIKYWVLALVLLVSAVTAVPLFATVSPINIVVWAFAFRPGPELWFVVVLLALEWFAPRVFCRALCPAGAFYSLWGRFSPWRVKVAGEEANRLYCRLCTVHCPMGIDIMTDFVAKGRASIDDPECSRCGSCTDVCRGELLSMGWTSPRGDKSALNTGASLGQKQCDDEACESARSVS